MAQESKHTLIQYGDAATPEEFADIAEVTSIGGPSLTATAIDTTTLDDDAKTFLAGPVDSGEVPIEVLFEADATSHAAAKTAIEAGTVGNYQICFPDFGAGTKTVSSVDYSSANDMTTSTSHGLTTGQPVQFTTADTLPAPLALATTYYAIYVDADEFSVALTNVLAIAGTAVDLTDGGTGEHTVQIGTRYDFAALLTGMTPTASVDGAVTATLTFKITGSVT